MAKWRCSVFGVRCSVYLSLLAAGLLFPAAPGAVAQVNPEVVDQIYDAGAKLFDQYAPDSIKEEYEFPSRENWNVFWNGLQNALQSQSLEDLAWLKPTVQSALETLKDVPVGAPYADWLMQRLDYLDMADEAVRKVPAPTDVPPPPPPSSRGQVIPPRRPPAPPPPPEISKQRQARVRSRENWSAKLAGRPMPSRAPALVPSVKDVLKAEGVPPELVWLAEVESSFNPQARSPAGAAGLFQLMPATAQRWGLKTQPEDERLAPTASARAAAKYLRFLHGRFGDWALALAAYNAGEGRVGRVLKNSGGKTFEDVEDHLPVETQMYVPKVMATIAMRENHPNLVLPPPSR